MSDTPSTQGTSIEAKQKNLLAEIAERQAALDAEALARRDAVEKEYNQDAPKLAALQAERASELEMINREYGAKFAALEREKDLAYKIGHVQSQGALHAEATPIADAAFERVQKARQELGAALGDFWPLELARLEAGESHRTAVRQLNEVQQPGIGDPHVPATRLAEPNPDPTEKVLRGLAFASTPDAERALKLLQQHQAWRPPSYAMVQGVRTRIS